MIGKVNLIYFLPKNNRNSIMKHILNKAAVTLGGRRATVYGDHVKPKVGAKAASEAARELDKTHKNSKHKKGKKK